MDSRRARLKVYNTNGGPPAGRRYGIDNNNRRDSFTDISVFIGVPLLSGVASVYILQRTPANAPYTRSLLKLADLTKNSYRH